MARITGNDGNFALATFNLVANSWSMTVTPTVTDVTGFGDSHKIAVTGMATFSGSASGFLLVSWKLMLHQVLKRGISKDNQVSW